MPRFEPGKNELAFYKAERERWPVLGSTDISDAWATKALKKLVRHFHLDRLPYGNGPVKLTFKGRNVSWGGCNGITLAKARDWLIFLHEVAHVWEYRKHGMTEHRARLARYVDRLCRYAMKKRWLQADLDAQAQLQAEHDATEAFAVEPPPDPDFGPIMRCQPVDYPSDPIPWPEPFMLINGTQVTVTEHTARAIKVDVRAGKIAKREAQLARLDRKIKALSTRAKRVRRSLNALRRAQTPHTSG